MVENQFNSLDFEELNNHILKLFIDNIRYNAVNFGLNNITLLASHHNFIYNLSISQLKILSKELNINSSFNRAIMTDKLINYYKKLAKQHINKDAHFFTEITQRNIILEQQERDKQIIQKVNNIISHFNKIIPNLHGENLHFYIQHLGTYIQNIGINNFSPLPIILQNKFNILIFNNQELWNTVNTKTIECPLCYETKYNECFINTNCHHSICDDCFCSYIKYKGFQNKPCCSLCRTPIISIIIHFQKSLSKIQEIFT